MGIPKFFRWLTRRYPLILKNIKIEEDCPPIDNLYLDLNGIVHNCIHGNDSKKHERISKLQDFEEVWVNIMKAIDEIVHTVKPRGMIFLAVDGVAPRAKMNQQRARRFRSAKDATLLKEKLLSEGKEAPDLFDSNAISPGTKFMYELSRQLEFFVNYKLNTDPLYQKLPGGIILSDASVPGEGEHKMMDFIRQAKQNSDYNPNTRHCFYGADADLIMLSLITHEPNFIIIREEHIVRKIKQGGVQRIDLQKTSNFQLIFISLLREYFQLEFSVLAPKMKMKFDLERIIDDFVFFCFFIGNDFLPSLSALDISEGSLDSLIDLYKDLLPQMSNYITEAGLIYWDRAEPFINMLGKHEHESFQKRIHSIEQARYERIISFDPDFGKTATKVDKATLIRNKIKDKLNQKKKTKILHLTQKNKAKQFKKFLLMKRFEEDDLNASLTEDQKQIRQQLIVKYTTLREKSLIEKQTSLSENEKAEDKKQMETLKDIISGIKEEYFSDLQLDDIGDDEVSDVSESEIDITEITEMVDTNLELENKIKVQEQIMDKYSQQNLEFMTEFIKLYSQDPNLAKARYYFQKVKFDVNTPQGQAAKKKMLTKYLEGLQWVLYYYYKGAQHWRWYYPYHYAPMISDLDEGVVANFLNGKIVIDVFEEDHNCSSINKPYTPFQQLLSILPIKSLHLMPDQYKDIVLGPLKEFFPEDFDIDLNGRALPWEAACLIPFCDEKQFIELETELQQKHTINEHDAQRNIIHFTFKKYIFDENLKNDKSSKERKLYSSLTLMKSLDYNFVSVELIDEYKNVGNFSFLPKLLPGVQLPTCDFPSFKWLNINSFEYDQEVVNKVEFKKVLVKIPSCVEDKSNEDFEIQVNKFAKSSLKEMYVGFPFQFEGFPTVFEDDKNTYTLYGDVYTNIYKLHKDIQQMPPDKYDQFLARQKYKFQKQGFLLPENCNSFASFNTVESVKYDSSHNVYYKVYSQQNDLIPMCMVMIRRDQNHYLNVNLRCQSLGMSLKPKNEAVCLNMKLFGVVGKVDKVDLKKDLVKINFDKEVEESKIHDPFFGQLCLSSQDLSVRGGKRFYTEKMIEQELKLQGGIINRLTSSFLITFNDKVKLERQVIDLGLNLKNFTKKVHIPDYVRFVADEDPLASQIDSYQHNTHAGGYKHTRRHWEYSEECVHIIRDYYAKYREVFDCVQRSLKQHKQIYTFKDLYGRLQVNDEDASKRVKEIAAWIESLPVSHLPYVEMGFDALHEDLIDKLNNQTITIKNDYQSIKLKCNESEYLQPFMIYQEHFPFWTQPFSDKTVNDFRVGDRVMNVNSSRREYIPFGLRGTVVGRTTEKVIILFDEQYLNGNNIYGHCDDYKGGYIDPNYLINITKKFTSILKKNAQLVQNFQEQPYTEEEQKAIYDFQMKQEQEEQTQQYNPYQQQQQHHHGQSSRKFDKVKTYKQEESKGGQGQYQQQQQQMKQIGTSNRQVTSHRQVKQVYQAKQNTKESTITTTSTTVEQQIIGEEGKQSQFEQISTNTFIQQIQVPASQQETTDQISGFVPNPALVNNPDFQSLMDMMNLAKQLQQPLSFDQPAQNFNLDAQEFKPGQKKEEQK